MGNKKKQGNRNGSSKKQGNNGSSIKRDSDASEDHICSKCGKNFRTPNEKLEHGKVCERNIKIDTKKKEKKAKMNKARGTPITKKVKIGNAKIAGAGAGAGGTNVTKSKKKKNKN